jgi:hypothetical protein
MRPGHRPPQTPVEGSITSGAAAAHMGNTDLFTGQQRIDMTATVLDFPAAAQALLPALERDTDAVITPLGPLSVPASCRFAGPGVPTTAPPAPSSGG